MTDTQWADISSYQINATDQYGLRGIAVRSNDGTYRDPHFAANLAWAKHSCDTGKMDFFIVYLVFETNWQQTFTTFKAMVGAPHLKMAVMIDMESWSGRISGDQSAAANSLRSAIANWLGTFMSPAARAAGKQWKRVGGYGNARDLTNLWGKRSADMWVVLANYTSNPSFPGKLAHQYSDRTPCVPFGNVDMNSADGMAPAQVVQALGLDATASPAPAPTPPVPTGGVFRDELKHFAITADTAGKMNLYYLGKWVRSI